MAEACGTSQCCIVKPDPDVLDQIAYLCQVLSVSSQAVCPPMPHCCGVAAGAQRVPDLQEHQRRDPPPHPPVLALHQQGEQSLGTLSPVRHAHASSARACKDPRSIPWSVHCDTGAASCMLSCVYLSASDFTPCCCDGCPSLDVPLPLNLQSMPPNLPYALLILWSVAGAHDAALFG